MRFRDLGYFQLQFLSRRGKAAARSSNVLYSDDEAYRRNDLQRE